jgi:hypothetical protein
MSKELHSVQVSQIKPEPTFLSGLEEEISSEGILLPKQSISCFDLNKTIEQSWEVEHKVLKLLPI